MNGRPQTGIFGCVSVSDYDDDTILKHEKTRPTKEDDRTRHIIEQRILADPPKTLQYLADEFGISRERIRQIEQNALKKLRTIMSE